ncbi:MAG: hypothetical protein QNJ06_21285 [Kiloniellales bacterium]|nr:hypothetical protein [Kiloniellales bacterium]
MLKEINNLKEIARRCSSCEPLDERLARWLAECLQEFLDHRCPDLHEALGLKSEQGGVPWWLEYAIRERNAALNHLANVLPPADSTSALAKKIYELTVRYAASAWRFDQFLEEMPQRYLETPMEYIWLAFKSGAPMPLGERQLRNILAR